MSSEEYQSYLKELYAWIIERYNAYKSGTITKEQYDADLDHYNNEVDTVSKRLRTSLSDGPGSTSDKASTAIEATKSTLDDVEAEAGVSRTNSIAGLRAKMLEELEALRKGQ